MALKQYEGMFLLDSGKYASDSQGVVEEVLGLLGKIDAEIVAHRPWQDGKLAYPIEGHTKGVHYLVYFKADSLKLTELTRQCQLSDKVLRHMVIVPPTQLFGLMAESLANPAAAEESTSKTDQEEEVEVDEEEVEEEVNA